MTSDISEVAWESLSVPSLRVDGKVAVVSGAGTGIGRRYALGLGKAGADVVVAELNQDTGKDTLRVLSRQGIRAIAVETDVSDRESVRLLASTVESEFGKVDIVVNNAAHEGVPTLGLIAELSTEFYDRTLAVNAKGAWLMTQAFLPLFERARGGVIVNQGSVGAFLSVPGLLAYSASKNALIGITKVLARELGPLNIRVNCIAPGAVFSESLLASSTPEATEQAVAAQCLNARQTPEDLVGPLLFLCSEASRFITGQTLVIDGGMVMLP